MWLSLSIPSNICECCCWAIVDLYKFAKKLGARVFKRKNICHQPITVAGVNKVRSRTRTNSVKTCGKKLKRLFIFAFYFYFGSVYYLKKSGREYISFKENWKTAILQVAENEMYLSDLWFPSPIHLYVLRLMQRVSKVRFSLVCDATVSLSSILRF